MRLSELLTEQGLPTAVIDRIAEAPPPGTRTLIGRSLNGGFAGGPDGLMLVTDRELFGAVRVRRPKALRRVVPRDVLERLTPGDLVVHVDHGIARYEKLLRRGTSGEERDYLELSFSGTDKIFLPVEQINRISRYSGGENPALSKLGGGDWIRTKARVKKAVTDLAKELLEIYAARAAAPGMAYPPDTPWQQELEASFPYEETLDQLRATAEVKLDMEAGRPMDRLVVGDVGYGKTEVALRGIFKAIQGGKQVAVLVPTTVLAAQHYQTFSQRFAAFPITVRLLSRFVPEKEQQAAVEGLAAGSVDLVIGTHRLLSKDVSFHDLGMVVVDEEQRFGVAAKERLKRLRREVDVLTLSATPIPRTLNLALAGVRDLSLIETPPEDRLPIQTRVAEASTGLVRDAILRELDRGGQVFFVHNRVETIEAQAEQLRQLLPGVRIAVGHGQMPEGQLEKVMLAFAGGATEVLVCTTIIESGLDIPNANTIIIDRADTLGLAQLYQLRGRVGRSSRRAYAYLLYRRREKLSDVARKRLQAIFNASELGAGFQIALSDLEIRGAGNILGAEQHGHVAAVGFDLYTRLLAEAVEEQKAEFEGRPAVVERSGRDRRSSGRRPPAGQLRPRDRPEARALSPSRPRPGSRRAGRLPPGAGRPLRAAAGRRSSGSSRSSSSAWPPRTPASPRSRARKATSSSASARCRAPRRCGPWRPWAATSSASAPTRPASDCLATRPGPGAWPSRSWPDCCPSHRSSRSSATGPPKRRDGPSSKRQAGLEWPESRNLWAAGVHPGVGSTPGGVRHGQPVASVAPAPRRLYGPGETGREGRGMHQASKPISGYAHPKPARKEAEGFRPDIEGLRGIAVTLVVLFHAGLLSSASHQLTGGFIGVDLFFVVSGFLITGLLIRERERTGRISFSKFYARRVRRILPAAAVVLLITLPLSYELVTLVSRSSVMEDGASAALSVANIRFAQTTDYFNPVNYSPFLHFWSLGVEEQFYFVWPALMAIVAWKWPRPGAAVALVGHRRRLVPGQPLRNEPERLHRVLHAADAGLAARRGRPAGHRRGLDRHPASGDALGPRLDPRLRGLGRSLRAPDRRLRDQFADAVPRHGGHHPHARGRAAHRLRRAPDRTGPAPPAHADPVPRQDQLLALFVALAGPHPRRPLPRGSARDHLHCPGRGPGHPVRPDRGRQLALRRRAVPPRSHSAAAAQSRRRDRSRGHGDRGHHGRQLRHAGPVGPLAN